MLDPITDEAFKKLKGKNWCFTLAHANQEDMKRIKTKIEEENEKLIRAVVGIERGKQTNLNICKATYRSAETIPEIQNKISNTGIHALRY
jgi:hypothetical protein